MEQITPFDRAIQIAGNQSKLAKLLDVTAQTVTVWKEKGVHEDRCPMVEAVTGVRCEELRPDIQWDRDETGKVVSYRVPVKSMPEGGADVLPA